MEPQSTRLDVTGYDGAPVNATLRSGGSDTLAVLLPGQGYSNAMPAMFYAGQLVRQRGFDTLRVDYDYRDLPDHTPMEERVARLDADAAAAFRAGLAAGDYRRVVLIGKSLGTIAMASLLASGIEQAVKAIWLTPLLRYPEIREAMNAVAGVSFVGIGSADHHFDPAFLTHLRGKGAEVCVLEGANHGFGYGDDVLRSIDGMRALVAAMDGFF